MTDWPDGKERRSANITLNDILLELREMKSDFKGEMKLIYERIDNHAKEDTTTFNTISALIKTLTSTVSWLQKGFFVVIGGYVILQFLLQARVITLNNYLPAPNYSSGSIVSSQPQPVGRHENVAREGGAT